jgi:hypothetical protein
MAMDGGIAGLEQSQYHPLARRSQYSLPTQQQANDSLASSQGGSSDLAVSLIYSIKACIILGKEDKVLRLLCELRELDVSTVTVSAATFSQTSRTSFSDNDPVTISQLKAILQETLQKPVVATPQRPSYTSVARQSTAAPTGNVQLIPEH